MLAVQIIVACRRRSESQCHSDPNRERTVRDVSRILIPQVWYPNMSNQTTNALHKNPSQSLTPSHAPLRKPTLCAISMPKQNATKMQQEPQSIKLQQCPHTSSPPSCRPSPAPPSAVPGSRPVRRPPRSAAPENPTGHVPSSLLCHSDP